MAFVVFALCVGLAGLVAMSRPVRAALWLAAITVSAFAITLWFPMVLVTIGLAVVALVDSAVRGVRSKQPVVLIARAPVLFALLTAGMGLLVWRFGVEPHEAWSTEMEPTVHAGDHVVIDRLHHRSPLPGDLVAYGLPRFSFDELGRVIALPGETVEVRCDMVYVNGKRLPSTLDDAHATYQDPSWPEGPSETRPASRYHEWLGDRYYDVFYDRGRPERDRGIMARTQAGGSYNAFPSLVGPPPWSCVEDKAEAPLQQALCTLVDGPPVDDRCAPHRHYVVPADHVFVLSDNRAMRNDSRAWGSVPIASIKGHLTGIWYSNDPDGIRWERLGEVW